MGRHGRKNRRRVREIMGKRDPEREIAYRELHRTMRDENGRLLRYKKYADRELMVMTGGDQHNPELTWLHYDEIAERNGSKHGKDCWVSRKMSRKFGLDADLDQRCWYTGTQMYFVPWDLFYALGRHTPWMCSREHLVCERNGGAERVSNIVIAGLYMNDKLGHSPLPLKLLHRQQFAKREFDRDTPTWNAVGPWIRAIIEVERQYQLGNHYPWQPWAFDAGSDERRTADAFNAEMMVEEQKFLALDDTSRQQWLDEFVWRW